jgi:hypothetical protein
MTIRLVGTASSSRYLVDHAPKGYPNKGDVVRATSNLRNAVAQFGRPKGAIVGSDVWITTIVIPPFGKVDVKVATTVPGGTIRSVGTLTATQMTGSFRVVGGTGRYASARGALSLGNFSASASRAVIVYRLQLP